jgi:multidrug efflux pump subunit AcrB
MRLTQSSLANPAAVAIVAAVIALVGVLSVFRIPAQLLPQIEKPIVTVFTAWPGAAPKEVESELTVPVEEVLQGTPGMTELISYSMPNFGFMQLEFALETDMTRTLIEIISRLNRLRPLPANAERPQVSLGEWGDANDQLIEYYVEQLDGDEARLIENKRFLREIIVPELGSLYGVAQVDMFDTSGNSSDQLQIVVDPYKAAELGIDVARAADRIGRSANISSGVVDVGRRSYTLRIEGRYDVDELAGLILEWRGGLPVTLGDVATIEYGPPKREGFIYHNGLAAARLAITKTTDANVLEALELVKARIDELNETIFKERGMRAEYNFDPALYIDRSINLLAGNLIAGIMLAIGVLWLFLRQWRATFIIALAIPVSLLATFAVLSVAGRSLNVISLAGLAFATGMVLDAAIVVLENIVRLREEGERPETASDKGTNQVWGALLASTATTVAIFIPIMFLEDVEGQMFADLALTIAIGVSMSLLVAITILPTAARSWMRQLPPTPKGETTWDRLASTLIRLTSTQARRLGWIGGLMAGSIFLTVMLWPESNYLPPVKRDTVDSFLFFPPGTNVDTSDREIAQLLIKRLEPHLNGTKEPTIRDYFLWSFPGGSGGWLAINPIDGADLDEFQAIVQSEITAGIPDLFGFTFRRSLFGGFEDTNSVELRLTSTDLDALKPVVAEAMQLISAALPGSSAQPQPDPFAEANELRFRPNDVRLAEVGWTREDLTRVILQLGQGVWLGEYFTGRDRVDIYLKTTRLDTPEAMEALPLATPLGGVVPLGDLATIDVAPSPAMIVRINRGRAYSVIVNPPEGMSLEALINELQTTIEPQLSAMMPADGGIQFAGSAKDLERAVGTLGLNFLTAIGLLVLIMAGLFRSLKDAVLVVISIPLAAVGGVLAITLVNTIRFQPLDLLGMIGFIILLGLVVNNGILLVAQTRAAEAEGLSRTDAVHQALRYRLRPIFMSTLTSLFGMLPLLIVPGAGSDIYRGMAAAIVGGMSVSTLFTLLLLPSLLQLTGKSRQPIAGTESAVALRKAPPHRHRTTVRL